MNNTIKNVLIFSLGAAAGSLVAWRFLKTKYEQITQNEIDAYKEYVKSKQSKQEDTKETTEDEPEEATDEATDETPVEKESIVPLDILARYRSDNYEREDRKVMKEPYVIAPEAYGILDGYECVSLTYYADGVITDEHDNVIQDPDDILVEDVASHFGEYEDDSVFVRNEALKRDYEILRDLNTFTDTMMGYSEE